jgi:hypothetical protein
MSRFHSHLTMSFICDYLRGGTIAAETGSARGHLTGLADSASLKVSLRRPWELLMTSDPVMVTNRAHVSTVEVVPLFKCFTFIFSDIRYLYVSGRLPPIAWEPFQQGSHWCCWCEHHRTTSSYSASDSLPLRWEASSLTGDAIFPPISVFSDLTVHDFLTQVRHYVNSLFAICKENSASSSSSRKYDIS